MKYIKLFENLNSSIPIGYFVMCQYEDPNGAMLRQ